ncbi:zona pellucida sperm-binding protein 3-like [Sinocyclocheilus anshuiensis]|uniref:zona pellucida sperm-binding protein 3-like n=1 Tax=Sinocyclocheilus anshuiensis TaxID=1608454 RepID=UPI0007BA45B9|nr:PREDICTED: zona pellucida sperm-binding protein 3-like [Sinocyclocheilus anshuiensis]
MRLVVFSCVGLLLLIAVDLSLAQWSRFQQGQDPLRFQQQQSPVLAPQQSVQDPQASTTFRPLRPVMRPAGVDAWKLQEPGSSQSKQLMQAPMAPLTWHFPVIPEEPQQPDVPFEQCEPIAPQCVAAQCGENFVHVEVKKDFFGTGQLVNPSFLTLGGCAAVGENPEAEVLIFEYELQTCDHSLVMTDDELVYTFNLLYTPAALVGTPIVRADAAAVGIECHYSRLYNVSSNILLPAWVPFAATKVAEEVLVFSLRLMTDDWMFERPSNQYFLGQFLKLEASVKQYNHVPLCVFVDGCVATAAPDVNTPSPRYPFIENHGCLVDAKLTGSTSSFMHRVQNDKLQFQLEAFRFQRDDRGLVYITCALKAVMASTPTCPENKACSFINGWTSVDDNDQVCMCCDTTCGLGRKGQALSDSGLVSEGKATIGPVVITL